MSTTAAEQQYNGWSNRQTERLADEIFGSRQTFFFVQEVISDGKDLDKQTQILCELMTGWLTENWEEDNTPRQQRIALKKVSWRELAQYIMDYQWGA